MIITAPEYYHRFRCIASDCPDSCCKEWEVDVDSDAADFYRALPGELGDRLRQVLRTEDGATLMAIENGRCPMWRNDGLCRIQAELGHDALCVTCRDFPRLRHDYGDFVELGLELSCPEAARLIFSDTDQAITEQALPGGDAPDYDPALMDILLRSRDAVLSYLDTGVHPIHEALAVMLLYSHSVQAELDGGNAAAFDPDTCLAEARKYAQPADAEAVLDFFRDLEVLTDRWRAHLATPTPAAWNETLRYLAVYGIRRYWLQAVSDFDLICRVKFIIIACILAKLLGGDPQQTAQLFSKEIENDPDNVEAILNGAYTAPAFTDANLLGLLQAS